MDQRDRLILTSTLDSGDGNDMFTAPVIFVVRPASGRRYGPVHALSRGIRRGTFAL
jgi:hypothetical protein